MLLENSADIFCHPNAVQTDLIMLCALC